MAKGSNQLAKSLADRREMMSDVFLNLTFHADSGHGWLAVPMSYLRDWELVSKITPYSYKSKDGETAYLEEDMDAATFVNEAIRRGQAIKVSRVHDGDHSFIRGLERMWPEQQPARVWSLC